ncbi:MAG: SGNH/GDSL hydrolase family protein [Polyangiaceae bacterium]
MACFVAVAGCSEARSERAQPPPTSDSAAVDAVSASADARRTVAPPLPDAGMPAQPNHLPSLARAPQCRPPSLDHHSRIDARTGAALEHCEPLRTGLAKISKSCGLGERKAKDLARLILSVPELDDATRAHAREVFERGRALGRRADVFGLVGDSVTVSGDFMRPFSAARDRSVVLGEFAEKALALPDGRTVIDFFRSGRAEVLDGKELDPFRAFRAAMVGARASFATDAPHGAPTPIDDLVRRISPAYAVVTFGANDAAYRVAPPEQIADEFEKHTLAAVRALEDQGVVVILSNEMRHGDQPGVKACPSDAPQNDWRVAVGQNANSARAAEIACREHLPFIDLRHALDAATNFGLGPDAVHLSSFKEGAGVLDDRGLDCGYNIRNFVTLLALRRVVEAVDAARAPQ